MPPRSCFANKHKTAYANGHLFLSVCVLFFFQAEDGIRDWSVTGVQTCALPILFGPIRCTARIAQAEASVCERAAWASPFEGSPASVRDVEALDLDGCSADLNGLDRKSVV